MITLFSSSIDTIDIDYMSGDIDLKCDTTDTVTIKETTNKSVDEKMKVHSWVDGTTLYIRFCASSKGLDFNDIEKKLELTLPADVTLSDLIINVSSGDVTAKGFTANSVETSSSSGGVALDCTSKDIKMEASSGGLSLSQHGDSDNISLVASSGSIKADVENADMMDITVSSGDVDFSGTKVKDFEFVASSGEGKFTFAEAPENSEFTASSGDIDIYVPEKSDLTVISEHSSGDFDYDLSFEKNGDKYVCGSGTNKMSVTTSSGDAKIKKLKTGE